MRQRTCAILALLLLLQFLLCANLSGKRPFMDEGSYLSSAWLFSKGETPYTGFILEKPLGIVFTFSALFSAFPASILSARLAMAAVAMLQLLAIFFIAKKFFDSEPAALAAGFLFAMWSIPFSSYLTSNEPFMALLSSIALFFMHECLVKKRSYPALIGFGLPLGLSILFKQTMVVYSAFFAIAFFALCWRWKKQLPSKKETALLFFLIAAPAAIMCAYLLLINSFNEFVATMLFLSSLVESGSFLVIDARSLIAVAAFAFMPVALIGLLAKTRFTEKKEKELLLLLLWFSVGFVNMFPFRGCCFHLLPSLPAASLIGGFIAAKAMQKKHGKKLLLFSVVAILSAAAAAIGSQMVFSSEAYGFENLATVCKFIEQNSGANERILVMPAVPETYFLSKRMPAASQMQFFDQYGEQFQQKMIGRIIQNKPVLVVYFSKEKNLQYTGPHLIDAFIRENFEETKKIELHPPLYKFFNYAIVLKPK